MDNALYYTLSTIAQTLAGALAILVAVVLFKLAALAKERELSADIFDTYSVDADVYLPIARTQGYDAMLAASSWHRPSSSSRSGSESSASCSTCGSSSRWCPVSPAEGRKRQRRRRRRPRRMIGETLHRRGTTLVRRLRLGPLHLPRLSFPRR